MAKKVKIGLIGAGRIGRLHGDNIANAVPGAVVEAVADPFLNDATIAWANEMGCTKCYKDAEAIFADPEIDAVFICSSTDTHADYMIAAAKAGKHVFCEKPIDLNLDKIRLAMKACEDAKVKLQVGFVRRFDKNHKAVRDAVASDMMGRPHIVKVTSRDPEEPPMEYVKVSGGMFTDMLVHDFDMARYLSGSEITEVSAYGTVCINEGFKEYDDVDTAIVMLKFESGAIGVIDGSRAARYGYDQRVEVHCAKGCVQDDNVLNSSIKISTVDGVQVEKPNWFFLQRYNDAFIAEVIEFVDCIQNDKEPSVSGIDGLMSVAIAMAAKKSLKEGRAVQISEVL
ncbi:inositol 2-dehydrogenase [Chakrabartyella piscis]|uniref:inositol 2-dehydrogenase n=1 Tax=Chakrabartyella piscis TaxID=2918914 RepID=UPI0029586965|nr:inositol 2-dehydrogenase [Chakrabartyella piscis]